MTEPKDDAVCGNCGRPVRVDWQPPFMEEEFPTRTVYHTDGGDALFCYEDERTEEAEFDEH